MAGWEAGPWPSQISLLEEPGHQRPVEFHVQPNPTPHPPFPVVKFYCILVSQTRSNKALDGKTQGTG